MPFRPRGGSGRAPLGSLSAQKVASIHNRGSTDDAAPRKKKLAKAPSFAKLSLDDLELPNDLTSSTTLAKLEQQVSALKVQLLSATNDLTNAKEDCLAYEAENEKVRVATPQKLGKMLPSSRSAHPTADGPTGTQIRMPDPK